MPGNFTHLMDTDTSNIADISANSSSVESPPTDWFTVVFPVVTGLHVFLNALVLLPFIVKEDLRTSFTVYVICLSLSNTIQGSVMNVIQLIGLYRVPFWAIKNEFECSVYLYMDSVFAAGATYCHVLITINRLWALTFPVSYRQSHTKGVAIVICGAMWLYVHAISLPFYLQDEVVYRRRPVAVNGCMANTEAQPHWVLVVVVSMYIIPTVVILGAYPFLWYFHQIRNKRVGQTVDTGTQEQPRMLRRQGRSGEAFRVLTCLTITIAVCWLPTDSLYILRTVSSFDTSFLDEPALVLYVLQGVIDPVLFVISLRDLKKFIMAILCHMHR
ncbi:pyroglutamylated RF-amide peptide receptor-like [Paramacrobiotus metropolitanus]|uniref:pyroglutamylated RF-amide peptide receptor-like n=1 Tax=Paramacrobiotus metropolitanus TaxID=2943436 RepID=UPI002445797D|nr:pyroglutamylated RF-amide peptide receptor-like [Paramacrobiotus metropolitanus]